MVELGNESILTSIKKLLGIEEDYIHFDTDILICINSVFTILTQLGVGPAEGFSISDKDAVWNDYGIDMRHLNLVKHYVYKKVKLMFDPPLTGSVMEAMKEAIKEDEWRLNAAVETPVFSGEGGITSNG